MNKDINMKELLQNEQYKECIIEFEKIIYSNITKYLNKHNIKTNNDQSLLDIAEILNFNFPNFKGVCEYIKEVSLNEDISSLEILDSYVDIYKFLRERLT